MPVMEEHSRKIISQRCMQRVSDSALESKGGKTPYEFKCEENGVGACVCGRDFIRNNSFLF